MTEQAVKPILGAAQNTVVHIGPSSAEVMRDLWDMHFPYRVNGYDVLDLTYGSGTFWKGITLDAAGIRLTKNDRYVGDDDVLRFDYEQFPFPDDSFDVVVFDPPFTANGPGAGHNDRYRATRGQEGAPNNVGDVRLSMLLGLGEACRLARESVIVKVQDVVESGKLHLHAAMVEMLLDDQIELRGVLPEGGALDMPLNTGWGVEDYVLLNGPRRPQPDTQRGATVRHFRNRPSAFVVARRKAANSA